MDLYQLRCGVVVDQEAYDASPLSWSNRDCPGVCGAEFVGPWGAIFCPDCKRRAQMNGGLVSSARRRRKRGQRDRIIFAYLDTGASYRETARDVGCSVGTVAGAAVRWKALRSGVSSAASSVETSDDRPGG